MRKMFTVAMFLTLGMTLTAQQATVRAEANSVAEGEIKALELKMADLIVKGDWDEYAKHVGEDYLHTRENGQVENKSEALDSLRDVKRKIIVMEMEPASLTIRVYGDTVVSSAEFTVTVRDSGQVKGRRIRLSEVFVKREGGWWLIAEQGSTIGK